MYLKAAQSIVANLTKGNDLQKKPPPSSRSLSELPGRVQKKVIFTPFSPTIACFVFSSRFQIGQSNRTSAIQGTDERPVSVEVADIVSSETAIAGTQAI
jgi:hypothetical protein